MSEIEHPRLILHNFLSPAECKELEFIHKSCSTIGYRPNVFSTTLSHLIATNSPHLIIPFVSIRERLKEKIEETFGCEFELFIEFTGLISWCRGASIGWHSDDNRSYLKQRDFAAVCYLNSYGKDFKGGLFRFQSGEPATVAPSAGDVIIYTADDRNIHSVDEVTDGERLTLALWFSRDSSHDEDAKLLSRLSQCTSHGVYLPLPASTSMYWFCPHQDASNQNIGFDICVARLHLLGFDVYSLQGEDHSMDGSEQLMGPLQLAKGRELLTQKYANILHALQVVQFYHWKASELETSNVENDTLEKVKAMSHSQLETINALKSVFMPDENLITTIFGYSCSDEDQKDSLDLTGISLAIISWEEYTCKLLKELFSSLPQWKTYQTIHKVESD
ncbi:Prolyl 4-hydroxylase alpha subunit [Arabidopsis thaliana x Arabidopsis arenosa]|uniref:procollagen-proline 3-dioxygenase n=1 Tax=Arabidopsis thaliana x Arabidopsis arenosa TaxID=1240361 RepID=A0A8T2BFT9_9BRAS|nr:Prolyl 4-hydroxylase alpha subunit [Arabidopsis thaliana x Arabidopsis arenosa]